MRTIITIIIFFIFSSCSENIGDRTSIVKYSPSKMYISDITYIGKDTVARKKYCIYKVSFKNDILVGERDFCFIDSIGKYKLDDKFPKKY